jgi:Asp-tRNA(Asn)/Glu-tRNA(Gln) amidotransferase A subunit family amidase
MDGGRAIQEYTATECREDLAAGRVDLEEFHGHQLAFAQAVQARVQPFASLDDRVIALQARHRKEERTRGEPLGRLYGVPVAVEDVFDTVDFPTTYGSRIHEGRYAVSDAAVVRRAREAGAIVFGKTASAEFAGPTPGTARNPHDPSRTPGTASGGSAAAVASGAAPLALTLQVNGSVIRAASFCGVYGFVPSTGLVPRTGALACAPSLDRVGLFARSLEDIALATEILSGDDGDDEASRAMPPRQLLSVCRSEPPVPPRFCFVGTPWWGELDPEAREACVAFADLMQGVVTRTELPATVEHSIDWHDQVLDAERAFALQREFRNHPDQLSVALTQRIEHGIRGGAVDYLAALDRIPHVACAFDEYFEHYDAILTPAAFGAAPPVGSPIDPRLQNVWGFAGLPAVSLPLLTLAGGLPLGIQAVGSLHNDGRLLRALRWLVDEFIHRSNG